MLKKSLAHGATSPSGGPPQPLQWVLKPTFLSIVLVAPMTVALSFRRLTSFALLLLGAVGFASSPTYADEPPAWKEEATKLVEQIRAGSSAKVVEPQMRLVEIAPLNPPEQLEAFLALLLSQDAELSAKTKDRLAKVETAVVEEAVKQKFQASRFSLSEPNIPLAEVLEHLAKQTGNRLVDYRGRVGQDATPRTLSLDIKDQEFWPALDSILDQAALGPYEFSGDEGLALVDLEPGSTTRLSRGSYTGPFRIEASELASRRSMVTPQENRLHVKLHVAWEPRLQPLSITQRVADIEAVDDQGNPVPVALPEAEFDIDVPPDSYSTEIMLPLELPARDVRRIKSLTGKLQVLAPARQVEFRFDNLKKNVGSEQEAGGVIVRLEHIVKLEGLYEVHMRLRLKSKTAELDSHGDWVFQNLTLLEDKQGMTVDHAGFETTMRNDQEMGFAYLFEIEDEIENYTWVYRTPAAIQAKTVEYKLKNLVLP
ncbi:hypothetical protein [Adhaeretor mobilis]|uniref:Uncharacterized protein n=1 Tax=Adhaeretor mobilis TaxID=1930276 RepID=A0A517MQ37_9BACT|nr:hypothetical protein [Adhaeretor mobilis]QDS96984.1 hypothetical protein HG15A2_02430 [Adhaeretor mobilis]